MKHLKSKEPTTPVEEARAFLYEKIASNDSFAGQLADVVLEAIDSLIAVVEEQTKEKIRKAGVPVSSVTFDAHGKVMQLTSDGNDRIPSYFIPASAVAPKETPCGK